MTLRDTMENWQSEFLQLVWQVGGLSILWDVASPQSKSESDRLEEKVDILIQKLDPDNAETPYRIRKKVSKEIVDKQVNIGSSGLLRSI